MEITTSSTPAADGDEGTFHGVLGYKRESDWTNITLMPQSARDHTVWCEFCGEKAKPPLDFSKTPDSEDFCCAQYMEMFKKMEQQWRSLQEQSAEPFSNVEEAQDPRDRARSQDTLQQVAEECQKKSKRPFSGNPETEMPGCKVTSSGLFTNIAYRLLDFVRWRKDGRLTARENDMTREEMAGRSKLCGNTGTFPAGFGLCHCKGQVKKFYPNGNKFLTVLPDGTAQVSYPSGNLAIIAFVDDTEGVCIVLDDSKSSCPIRAFFQSSGMAACYHSNGSTCLHMDMWGGLSVNEARSRSRKWKWTDGANIPTPFKPIHMSLNKHVGVRVRGRESVAVTFLASGQQARFSVGSCTKPSEPAPSPCKEELMLQVSQLNARLALERLRWCHSLYSDAKRRTFRPPRVLVSQGRRLLSLGSRVCMDEKDRAYVEHCLQDCQ